MAGFGHFSALIAGCDQATLKRGKVGLVMNFRLLIWAAFLLTLMAGSAQAHENEVILYGPFLGGFTHPVLGLDHFLAMVSVGIVSAIVGGSAIWLVPALFVIFMGVGGLLGFYQVGIPMEFVEIGIAVSVILLGGIIAAYRKLPVPILAAPVAFFGMLHGYAHGAEIPSIADPTLYALGFISGTIFIHVVGVIMGDISRRYVFGRRGLQLVGAIFVVIGVLFILGVL